ncbi:Leucine-rich repeat-containing protein 37A2, partial [Galemys pyrenaicus]
DGRMADLVPFTVPTERDKTLLVWELSSGPTAEALHHSLFTVFSQFGLLYSVRVFPNAAVARPGFYAIVKFYSARDARRAQKACDLKPLFQTSPVKVHLSTRHKAVQHKTLALNSSQCQELANYYFGFNGWSKRIIKDLSDLEDRENEDTVASLQKKCLRFFCALEVVLPAYECRSPGVGIAEESLDNMEEGPLSLLMKRKTTQKLAIQKALSDAFQKLLIVVLESGKIAVEYRPCEDIRDARVEEELQTLIEVSYFSWKQYGQGEEECLSDVSFEEEEGKGSPAVGRRRPTGLGRCAWEPPHVMSRLRLWAPRLLLTWQPLWLLFQAAPELALDPVQLTSDPPGPIESWSSHSSDLPPESPQALTPPAEPGGFNYPESSIPAQMLTPPQEFTGTSVPFLDTDSVEELSPVPTWFAVSHQEVNSKLTQHQRAPEVIPMLGWDQNQALTLSPRLKSKILIVGLDQPEDHQSYEMPVPPLNTQNSKPARYIFSPAILKKGVSEHPRFAKVVRTPGQFSKTPHRVSQQLQNDYVDPSTDIIYPEDNQPLDLLGDPEPRPEPQEGDLLSQQEGTPRQHSQTLEDNELFSSKAKHPETSEETEPLQQESSSPEVVKLLENSATTQPAPAAPLESSEESDLSSVQEEAPDEPSFSSEEVELPSVQEEALAQPTEEPEEMESSPNPHEAATHPPGLPTELIAQPLLHHEENVPVPSENEAQPSDSPSVTLKPVVATDTITPEDTNEVAPTQQEAEAQLPESPEEDELTPAQQEAPVQEEDPVQPTEGSEEVEPAPNPQESPAQPPESSTEAGAQPSAPDEENVPSPSENEAQPSNLPSVTVKPIAVTITITPEVISEVEPTPVQQEAPAQPIEAPEEVEPATNPQESLAQPPESSTEVGAQPLAPEEENIPSPSENEAQPSNVPSVTVKPVAVTVTLTPEVTSEVAPTQQEAQPQPPESPEEVEPSPVQQEAPAPVQPMEAPEEVEPATNTQEAQPPESSTEVGAEPSADQEENVPSPTQNEAQPSHLPSNTAKPMVVTVTLTPEVTNEVAPTQQEAQPQLPESPEEVEPSPVQQEAPAQPIEAPEEVEPATNPQESLAQPPESSTEVGAQPLAPEEENIPSPSENEAQPSNVPSVTVKPVAVTVTLTPEVTSEVAPTQQEAQPQPPESPEEVEPSPVQQEAPAPVQPMEAPEEVEPATNPQESLAQPPESSTEVGAQPLAPSEENVPSPSENEAQPSNVPSVTVKPMVVTVTLTPEVTNEVETSPAHEETAAQPAQPPEKMEPPVQEVPTEFPQYPNELTQMPASNQGLTQHITTHQAQSNSPSVTVTITSEPSKDAESSATQQGAPLQPPEHLEETEPSLSQHDASAKPSESPGEVKPLSEQEQPDEPSGEVEPSPTQQEQLAQPPEHHEVASPGHHGQHSNLTNATVKPTKVRVTITVEPTTEVGPSPIQHEAQPSVPLNDMETSPQQEAPAQLPQTPEKVEPSPTQQETPVQTSELSDEVVHAPEHVEAASTGPDQAQLPSLPDVTVKPMSLTLTKTPELTGGFEISSQQEAPDKLEMSSEQVEPLSVQQEVSGQQPVPSETVETSPSQQENLAPPQGGVELSPAQQEDPTQHTESSEGTRPPDHSGPPRESFMNIVAQPRSEAQHPVFSKFTVTPMVPTVTITPEPTKKANNSPLHQNDPAKPPAPLEQSQPLSQTPESSEKVESSPGQQEAIAQTPDPPVNTGDSSVQLEAPDAPSESPTEIEPSAAEQEVSAPPPKPTEEVKLPTQQEASSQPPVPPADPTISSEPPDKSESLSQQETPYHLPEPPKKVESSLTQLQGLSQPSALPEKVEPSLVQKETPAQPESHNEAEYSLAPQESPVQFPETPEKVDSSPDLQVSPTPSSEINTEMESPNQQDFPTPLESANEVETPPAQQTSVQPPVHDRIAVLPIGQDEIQHSDLPSVTVEPFNIELTLGPTMEVEHSTALQQNTHPMYPGVTLPYQEQVQAQHPTLSEVTVYPLDLGLATTSKPSKEVEISPAMQETATQLLVAQSPVHNEKAVLSPEWDQAQDPMSLNVTISPLNMGLTITLEHPTKAKHSTTPQLNKVSSENPEVTLPHLEQVQPHYPILSEVTVQPVYLEITITPEPSKEIELSPPNQPPEPLKDVIVAQSPVYQEATPNQNQVQHPLSPNVTVQPLDLGLTLTTEHTTEAEPSTIPQQTTGPPKKPEVTLPQPEQVHHGQHTTVQPMDLEVTTTAGSNAEVESSPFIQEASAYPPESSKVAEQSFIQEVTVPTAGQDQGQHSISNHVTDYSLTLGFPLTLEHTTEAEPSIVLQQTTVSPKQPDTILPQPEQVQNQHTTVQPTDLEITTTAGSSQEVEPSAIMQEASGHSAEPPKEVMVEQPFIQEVTVSTSSQDQGQHSTSHHATDNHLDLGLTITPEHAMKAERSTVLKQIITPQSQHPNRVTSLAADMELTTTQQQESTETVFSLATSQNSYEHGKGHMDFTKQPGQNTTIHINICELCTCKDETLSCAGLSPKQRLRRVPVPGLNVYNGTFTTLDFQGNSISYIDENIWNSYRWAEKLIISENHLTELHKDSFEGLLSLQYLDLSCNKIQSIERRTFEPLPFLQFINLGCNLLTELSFGTFQAWHGMQFLHKLILSRNPLTTVEDSFLFKLPALKYLDMGTTQVSIGTVESILMMTLELEKLILPSRLACCLCQFKNTIEVVCKTVKLHCDSECLTNTTRCDEEASIGNTEGSFMKVLQARKKNTSTELTIEPEKPTSDLNGINFSAFMNEQLDFNDESDVISALNYILPYFSEGNLEDVESTLLPFIKLLFSNVQSGDKPLGHLKNSTGNPSLKTESNNSTYKNKLRKLYFLENLLDAEIQEKIDEVKKKEKTAMLIRSNLLGPKFKRQIFPKKLETAQPQKKNLAKIQGVQKRPLRVNKVLKGPRGIQKRYYKEVGSKNIKRKQNARSFVENLAKGRRLRRPAPRKLEQLHMVRRPRKLVGNTANTEPSFIKEHKAAVSSFLRKSMWRPTGSTTPKPLPEAKNKSKDLSYTIFVLENADARVRNMKTSKPSRPRKKYVFHKSHPHVVHRTPKAKVNQKSKKETSSNRLVLAHRPPFSAVRRLINSPSREGFSSSGELNSQENSFPDLFTLPEPPIENSTVENSAAENIFEENISTENTTMPKETSPEIDADKNFSSSDSAVTADNFMPTVRQTNETQWEYHDMGTDLAGRPTSSTFLPFSSPGDQFEIQLNQQLRSLIPNNDVRRLISHVIRTLKMDCSETQVQLACAKLISRTGLLMKLLSEQQEVKVSKAEWDTDQWKNENYINESTEVQGEQKEQKSSELTKEVPGYGYNNKLILAISVTVVVMILIIIFCLIEIYSHRTASDREDKGRPRGFFGFLLQRKCSSENENQEGFFWRRRPLWLRDMYRPLNATRKKNMAQKLHDKDSSDEDEIFKKDAGEIHDTPAEKTEESTEEAGEESEAAQETATE